MNSTVIEITTSIIPNMFIQKDQVRWVSILMLD